MAATDVFKKKRERERRLWKELASAEVGDLLGVIRPSGVGGSHSQGDRQWTLQIELLAWRAGDGAVSRQPLVARKKTSERTITSMMKKFDDYDVVRMRARVALKNSFGSPQAEIVRMPEPSDDRDMMKIARSLKKPVVVKDRRFGMLEFDRGLDWFTGHANWGRQRVEVNLVADGKGAPGKSLEHARTLFAAQGKWRPQLAAKITDLHPLWLESWRLEDEKRLTAKQFAAKMPLETVTVEQNGAFQFWFDDGDLFGGHSVVVSGSLKRGVKEATIGG